MNFGSIGDLATLQSRQRQNVGIKQDISRLTQELSTGLKADRLQATKGNLAILAGLENDLARLSGFETAAIEASGFAQAQQDALDRFQDIGRNLSETLVLTKGSGFAEATTRIADEAALALTAGVSALNSQFAGRSLFSGAATDATALPSIDDLLAGVRTAVGGHTTAADVIAAVDLWLADPAGFDAAVYGGSDTRLAPMEISATQKVSFDQTATDPALKNILGQMALGALLQDPAMTLSEAEKITLRDTLTGGLLQSNDTLTNDRARLGFIQSTIETVQVEQISQRIALDITRSDIVSADPYQTATDLEAAQFQLESLYAVTAKMSRLSLVNFI
ncbi:flagellin [Sulfitobacter sp. S190]|uniref:flagellin n=1 Tax=Sulfitobacter sp. S190 TaxID=2867022 RepID=UPI0021A751EC|nr:flagellin [Sulfitobacter sp. S190]UWR22352.1 flagellar hook protein [Sulfitobacter sp. S190]